MKKPAKKTVSPAITEPTTAQLSKFVCGGMNKGDLVNGFQIPEKVVMVIIGKGGQE